MIKEFVSRFEAKKEDLKKKLDKHPENYIDIIKMVIEAVTSDDENDEFLPDPEKITEIDHGEYQGSILYLIPQKAYQPHEYYYVFVSYGSCSGCDTLEWIRCENCNDDKVTDKSKAEYLTLMLHIVQGLKKISAY